MSTADQQKIRAHYDAIADVYDIHYDLPRGRCYHTHLSQHVMQSLPKNGHLLDIGCGTGLFVEKYMENGGSAVGLDISDKMLCRARHRCTGSDFTVATGECIPFSDQSFDAISSLLVFSYVKDPHAMLTEAFRVLKPGGALSIGTLGKKLLTKGIPAIYKISEKINVTHYVMGDFGERYYNEEEMFDLFSSAGFVDIKVSWCSFAHIDMIDPLFHFARKVEPFVEQRIPQLAYNICASGKRPEK